LQFVLGQYVATGAEELDRSKLPDYLKLNYGNPADGAAILGGPDLVVGAFVDFQKYLYS
jgi:type I restriction enzyme R subunit